MGGEGYVGWSERSKMESMSERSGGFSFDNVERNHVLEDKYVSFCCIYVYGCWDLMDEILLRFV